MPLHHLFSRWLLLLIGTLALAAILFTKPTMRVAADRVVSVAGAEPVVFDWSANAQSARRVVASPGHPVFVVSEPKQVGRDQVTNLSASPSVARLAAQLSAFGGPSDYPTLLVTTYGSDSKPRRSVRLSPAEYEHAAAPSGTGQPETIQFGIPTVPQDAGFAVQAVNGELRVWHPGEAVQP